MNNTAVAELRAMLDAIVMQAEPDLSKMAEPFPVDAVSWRVGSTTADKKRGLPLAYIDARDVMDRLDAVCGIAGWQCRYSHAGAPAGTIKKTELKKLLREFVTDLQSCEELDQLNALLADPETKRLLDAAEKHIPEQYTGAAGEGDIPSIPEQIERAKAALTKRALMESLRYEREIIDPETGELRRPQVVSIEERRAGA